MTTFSEKVREFVRSNSGRVGGAVRAETAARVAFDHREHRSASLEWRWHLQDFTVHSTEKTGPDSLRVYFEPRYTMLVEIAGKWSGRQPVLAAVASNRIAFMASIMAGGMVLGMATKDGEVIARDFHLKCKKALIYRLEELIPVDTKIQIRKTTSKYSLFNAQFTIGNEAQHSGETLLLYCVPGLEGFSYL